MGDGTNLVLILAGELLKVAENLLIMGLHPSEVTQGYELACKKALEELDSTSHADMVTAVALILCPSPLGIFPSISLNTTVPRCRP